ncbi:MAG: DUF3089 domain-containing protein [Pseudomonadota bacterium]
MPRTILAALVALTLIACSDGSDSPPPADPASINPYSGYLSAQYDPATNWMCRPDITGVANACAADLSATIIFADGSTQLETFTDVEDPEADCFYLYPTISRDPSINSDLEPDIERGAAYLQVGRYRGVCDIYAPVYRQITSGNLDNATPENAQLAYDDVLDAFRQFIANHGGRPFFLVTHSQGTVYGIQLIREEIEGNAYLEQRFVAAHLIGLDVERPLDADTGGSFEQTPPCSPEQEISCFVAYSTFYANDPPGEDAFFGVTENPNTRPTCTNPVDLGSGERLLTPYFSVIDFFPYENPAENARITTPYFTLPDRVFGECVEDGGTVYLAIRVADSPDDALIDNVGPEDFPGWGTHNSDIPMAQGDLVRMAQRQLDEWLQQNR